MIEVITPNWPNGQAVMGVFLDKAMEMAFWSGGWVLKYGEWDGTMIVNIINERNV